MLRRATIASVCALPLLVACGNSRTPVPNLARPAAADGVRALSFPAAGVRFQAPRTWKVVSSQPPLVAVVTSGAAAVALWRYPRTQPLPSTPDQLQAARQALIGAARSRQATLELIRSSALQIDGQPAIELDAIEQLSSQLRRVRSTHVFAFGGEIVLEEYAPLALFSTIDHAVFSPLKRSLLLSPVS